MAKALAQKRESLSQVAYDQIKAMILQKELIPGQFINESQLQEMLCLGRTPVREAILALAQDNLVTVHPRRGIEITRPTPKDIHDIFEIRSLLEPTILRQCFTMVDPQWAMDRAGQPLPPGTGGHASKSICHQPDAQPGGLPEPDPGHRLAPHPVSGQQPGTYRYPERHSGTGSGEILPAALRSHSSVLSGGHQHHDAQFFLKRRQGPPIGRREGCRNVCVQRP